MQLKKITSALTALLCAANAAAIPVSASAQTDSQFVRRPLVNDCRSPQPLVTLNNIPNHVRNIDANSQKRYAAVADDLGAAQDEAYIPLLIISVGFNNTPYADDNDLSAIYFDGEYSLSQYYHEQSYGQFTFLPAEESSAFGKDGNTNTADKANDGIIHVNLDYDHGDWSDFLRFETDDEEALAAYETQYNTTLFKALSDALAKADDYVDFSSYDLDGSGSIETDELALGFVLGGYDSTMVPDEKLAEVDRTQYVWPHQHNLYNMIYYTEELADEQLPAPDGVEVSTYICIPESYDESGQYCGNETITHELGHYIGLPDLYDTEYLEDEDWDGYDVGMYSLMSVESRYDEAMDQYIPVSLDMWSKWYLGWVEPDIADKTGTYTVKAANYETLDKTNAAVVIATQKEDEFYLVECRYQNKWDGDLFYQFEREDLELTKEFPQQGLLLWHVDMTGYFEEYYYTNSPNNTDHHPCVMPLYGERVSEDENLYDSIGKYPATITGFYSKEDWELHYAPVCGDSLTLPVYGEGDDINLRDKRWLSGITVAFPDSAADTMHIDVNFDNGVHKINHNEGYPAGCEYDGLTEYWYDNIDDQQYYDPDCQNPVENYEDLYIPATGHQWDEGVVIKEPTEDEDGLILYTCLNDPDHTYVEVIPALGTETTEEVTEDTTEEVTDETEPTTFSTEDTTEEVTDETEPTTFSTEDTTEEVTDETEPTTFSTEDTTEEVTDETEPTTFSTEGTTEEVTDETEPTAVVTEEPSEEVTDETEPTTFSTEETTEEVTDETEPTTFSTEETTEEVTDETEPTAVVTEEPSEEVTDETEPTTFSTEETTDDTDVTEPTAVTEEATLPEGAYSLDELCEMALKDYEVKHGVRPEQAAAVINEDGTVTIQISDVYEGHVTTADYYKVDPMTGKGENLSGEEVNLPQTGNNSAGTAAAASGAALLTLAGLAAFLKSGILRRKHDA